MVCDSYSGCGNHNFKLCDFSVTATGHNVELMSFLSLNLRIVVIGTLTTCLNVLSSFLVAHK